MKKVISLILIIFIMMAISTTSFADILDDEGTGETETITGEQYQEAQKNTTDNNTALPQTGIEDSGLGILLIICAVSAVFAYKKISDYRNI